MKVYRVVFAPQAQGQLLDLSAYITEAASASVAERFTDAIITYCEGLRTFPERGMRRDDIRPGLRVTNYRGSTIIAFAVDATQVTIVGIYYGGLDYESLLNA